MDRSSSSVDRFRYFLVFWKALNAYLALESVAYDSGINRSNQTTSSKNPPFFSFKCCLRTLNLVDPLYNKAHSADVRGVNSQHFLWSVVVSYGIVPGFLSWHNCPKGLLCGRLSKNHVCPSVCLYVCRHQKWSGFERQKLSIKGKWLKTRSKKGPDWRFDRAFLRCRWNLWN